MKNEHKTETIITETNKLPNPLNMLKIRMKLVNERLFFTKRK